MDIFTHLMIGASATAPFWGTHPLESVAFVFGSILPDVDALSRQFGKVAYLRAHQTWTHAIPVQLSLAGIAAAVLWAADLQILVPSILAVGLGAALHSILDWTNTYGVKLFAPFDRSRRYLEWVFFIDAFVIAVTSATLALQAWLFMNSAPSGVASLVWLLAMVAYFAAKAALRRRAGQKLPNALSLVPSALWPWRFYALEVDGELAKTSTVSAWSGNVTAVQEQPLVNGDGLEGLAEYRVMRDLSVGFLPTAGDDGRIVFRDLRTRNFGTNFGRLTVDVSGETATVESFDV